MHIMVDLETWGLAANSAIRSIGAVVFDPYDAPGKFIAQFYTATYDETGIRQAGTVNWWSEQSEAAQSVFNSPIPLQFALADLKRLFYDNKCKEVWAHGSVFDIPLLECAYKRCRGSHPWKFWDIRDTRTIYDLANERATTNPDYDVKHHALHDAANQAIAVQRSYQKIFSKA